ncbi:MAG: ABC transporter substrate-binding protein [Pseudorhodoplanes sp.]
MSFERISTGLRGMLVLLCGVGAGVMSTPASSQQSAPAAAPLPVFRTAAITNPDPSRWALEVIKRKKLDAKHGFDLQFALKPVSVAYTEFINGSDPVCLCLTIATGARFLTQGVDVGLLWTYQAFSHAYIVTENPAIKTPADLAGHSLAGSTGSGSWVFQQYFLTRHQNVDLSKVQIPSIVQVSQAAHLIAKRVDAVTVYEDGKIALEAAQPGRFRFIPTFDTDKWKSETGLGHLPMFLFAVRASWYAQPANSELVRRFYAAYREAIADMVSDPKQTAALLGDKAEAPPAFVINTLTQYPENSTPTLTSTYRETVRILTQKLLPQTGLLDRPLTDEEVNRFVLELRP